MSYDLERMEFRGRTKSGRWVKGSLLRRVHPVIEQFQETEDHCWVPQFYEVEPETVGQAIGKRDGNGKAIFEHDRIVFEDGLNRGERGVIRRNDAACQFLIVYDKRPGERWETCSVLTDQTCSKIRIIGTEFDGNHPESPES